MSRSSEDHEFHFADADQAARAAAYLRSLAGDEVDLKTLGRRPRSLSRFKELLDELTDHLARFEGIEGHEAMVKLSVLLHDDLDAFDQANGKRTPSAGRVTSGLHRLMKELGGVSKVELEVAARQRARDEALSALPDGAELLRALDAIQGQLLRFEKVFVDSLRMSVAAGSVLPGQRLEAGRILERHGARPT